MIEPKTVSEDIQILGLGPKYWDQFHILVRKAPQKIWVSFFTKSVIKLE